MLNRQYKHTLIKCHMGSILHWHLQFKAIIAGLQMDLLDVGQAPERGLGELLKPLQSNLEEILNDSTDASNFAKPGV